MIQWGAENLVYSLSSNLKSTLIGLEKLENKFFGLERQGWRFPRS